jgi:ornithine--oxo-acid transaminase
MNSGAEGDETALNFAQDGRTNKGIKENNAKIICCEGNFQGRTIT